MAVLDREFMPEYVFVFIFTHCRQLQFTDGMMLSSLINLLVLIWSPVQLLELSYAMQYGYVTLTVAEQAAIMEVRVLAHVYQLLSHSHILVSSKRESRQQIACLFDRLQLYEK